MGLKMKNRSYRYDVNRSSPRHGYKYTNILNIKFNSAWWLYLLSNNKATSEAQFMKKLSNTEAELKKSVAHI